MLARYRKSLDPVPARACWGQAKHGIGGGEVDQRGEASSAPNILISLKIESSTGRTLCPAALDCVRMRLLSHLSRAEAR
ncbi:hypothetical protein CDL15_Pgr012223 [Punica granatum]|uniref:Uncharacterized protein n=1 Tax=Punica granatum TaxID=22663 RepID=A0A218XM01_PUNGR|nr:hypothetical protein CDL15_Pgr012223 [Punica granatum]